MKASGIGKVGFMTLEKWKRNNVYVAVQAADFSPEAFSWDDAGDPIVFRHPSSGAHFVFGGTPGNYFSSYVAGDFAGPELPVYSWDAIMGRFTTWLGLLKNDIETPDLWDQLRGQADLLAGLSDDALENTPFNLDERDEIVSQLNEFREYVTSVLTFSATQTKDLNSKIDYLIDATSRLGRKDWLNACIGALVSLIVVAALPPDVAHHCLQILWNGIAHLFGDVPSSLGTG